VVTSTHHPKQSQSLLVPLSLRNATECHCARNKAPERPSTPIRATICHLPRVLSFAHPRRPFHTLKLTALLISQKPARLPAPPTSRLSPWPTSLFIRSVNIALDTPARLWTIHTHPFRTLSAFDFSLVSFTLQHYTPPSWFSDDIIACPRRLRRLHPRFSTVPYIQHTYPSATPKTLRYNLVEQRSCAEYHPHTHLSQRDLLSFLFHSRLLPCRLAFYPAAVPIYACPHLFFFLLPFASLFSLFSAFAS